VLPEIERRYRVLPGREHRVIGGSSLSAILSLYALVKKAHLFSGAMLMSGSWQWAERGRNMVEWIKSQWQSPPPGIRIWQSVGNGESGLNLYEANFDMRDALTGIFEGNDNYKFEELSGGHDEPSWRNQINDPDKEGINRYGPLGFLFPA
jgi:enterochelin esterase-like enzyme